MERTRGVCLLLIIVFLVSTVVVPYFCHVEGMSEHVRKDNDRDGSWSQERSSIYLRSLC